MSEAAEQTVIHMTGARVDAMSKGMRLGEIRGAIGELEAACNRVIEASDDFTALCTLVGLKAGTDPSVVKTFISARCKETVDENRQQGRAAFDPVR